MKKAELIFSAVSVPVDYIMLVLAGITAFVLRYSEWIQEMRPVIFNLDYNNYLKLVLFISFVWLFVFALQGLYTITFHKKIIDELSRIVFACSTGLMLIIVYIFWQREFFDSRFIILVAWIFSIFYVSIARIALRYIRRLLLSKDWGITKVILIGSGKMTDDLSSIFYKQPALGYRIIERINDFDEDRINSLMAETKIDEMILADTKFTKDERSEMLNFSNSSHMSFKYVADIFDAQSRNVDIRSIGGVPLIEIKKTPLDGWGRIYKRIFDIILSFVLFVLFLPFYSLIAIIIKLDSKGPVIEKLTRVGKEGKKFRLYKFRSMIKNAHNLKYDQDGNLCEEFKKMNIRSDGPLFKNENDPRITRFGRFLRKTSLDEVPQLMNVLKGEMSLVGPRPHEPEEVKKYEDCQKKLLSIKSGMSGLAQVSGRSNLSFNDEVKLDLYYIENWSIKDDIQIIFKTIWIVLSKKGIKL